MEVIWTRLALADLQAIRDYIALGSEKYAGRFVDQLLKKTRLLTGFPNTGTKVPEFDREDVREIFHQSYRVV